MSWLSIWRECGDDDQRINCNVGRALGTPDESVWPGVTKLRDYAPTFPKWRKKEFTELFPQLDPTGLALMQVGEVMPLIQAFVYESYIC